MRHTFLVVTVKGWLKSVYIYGSYPKIKARVTLFWTTRYNCRRCIHCTLASCCLHEVDSSYQQSAYVSEIHVKHEQLWHSWSRFYLWWSTFTQAAAAYMKISVYWINLLAKQTRCSWLSWTWLHPFCRETVAVSYLSPARCWLKGKTGTNHLSIPATEATDCHPVSI